MAGIMSPRRQKTHQTLINIANVSKRLHATIARTSVTLQAVSVRTRLDKIVTTSGAILAKSLESDTPLDPQLEVWLSCNEPDMCLWILNDMERLISIDSNSGGKWWRIMNHAVHSVCVDAKINEAIKLFSDREAIFHFLLRPDVWNYRTAIQARPEMGNSVDSHAAILQTDRIYGRKEVPEVSTPSANTGYGKIEEVKGELGDHPEEQKRVDPKKIDALIQWLDGFACNDKYESTLRLRQPNTCAWLPETNQYSTWRNSEDSFLWLQGKPGAGKTILATSVIDTIRKTLQEGEFIGFFYCDFRNERATNAAGVMRSILCQLLRKLCNGAGQDLIQLVDDMVKELTEGTSILKYADSLASFISRTAIQFDYQPFVVIDALDECQDIENLLQALRQLSSSKGIRLFVTSRSLQVIKDNFLGLPSISLNEMAAEISADIELHVSKEVEGDRHLRILEENLKMKICVSLKHGADGMFRWVQCQIDTLKRCPTTRHIRKALESLPSGLEETYERILREINPRSSEGEIAMRALVWLVVALRSMHLVEILEALSIDIEARRLDREIAPVHGPALLDALGSLVVYNTETDILVLSHFTVKEYVVGSLIRANLPMHYIDLQVAHFDVLRLCMVLRGDQQGYLFPMLDYVFLHGFYHIVHLKTVDALVLDDMTRLRLDIQQHPAEWAQILKLVALLCLPCLPFSLPRNPSSSIRWLSPIYQCLYPEHDFIIYILISLLPEPCLRAFLHRSPFEAFNGTSPLVYATYLGKIEHARTLLSWGINVRRAGLDVESPYQVLPLEVAFYRGHHSLFDLFLAHWRAPVPSRLLSTVFGSQRRNYDPCMVVKLLRCDEFMEWVAKGQHQQRLLSALNDREMSRLSDQVLINTLSRLIQIGCDFSTPDFLQSALRATLHAIRQRRQENGRAMVEGLISLGLDVGAIAAEGDLAIERIFGKCKRGASCWIADCPPCSAFLGCTQFKQRLPVEILFVGRVDAEKSSLVSMVAGVPEGLHGSAQAPDHLICRASLLEGFPLQVWDTPGFNQSSDAKYSQVQYR
ncbi:hypothetical protein JVU11DRAFT_3995 [Chiua virens]|nr:hypothetical protein JVU11DRAFT_3995 [Chiua virens]